ncbi:hypothetical protein PROFUN_02562 [Planoprotostelium fungivorum]|uniref:Uncharacterized protein n=1 Tax=Planoprotostelium fungivorum TaxID=1890364 RepID=A0A2P6MPB2_9EUKA|nr:hypothetical protein PROFUN_02562 [Planoprotostelium fungivorum]
MNTNNTILEHRTGSTQDHSQQEEPSLEGLAPNTSTKLEMKEENSSRGHAEKQAGGLSANEEAKLRAQMPNT